MNRCGAGLHRDRGKIFFALAAIKGCGVAAARRSSPPGRPRRPFEDLFDFCERLDPGAVNRTRDRSP